MRWRWNVEGQRQHEVRERAVCLRAAGERLAKGLVSMVVDGGESRGGARMKETSGEREGGEIDGEDCLFLMGVARMVVAGVGAKGKRREKGRHDTRTVNEPNGSTGRPSRHPKSILQNRYRDRRWVGAVVAVPFVIVAVVGVHMAVDLPVVVNRPVCPASRSQATKTKTISDDDDDEWAATEGTCPPARPCSPSATGPPIATCTHDDDDTGCDGHSAPAPVSHAPPMAMVTAMCSKVQSYEPEKNRDWTGLQPMATGPSVAVHPAWEFYQLRFIQIWHVGELLWDRLGPVSTGPVHGWTLRPRPTTTNTVDANRNTKMTATTTTTTAAMAVGSQQSLPPRDNPDDNSKMAPTTTANTAMTAMTTTTVATKVTKVTTTTLRDPWRLTN
ncbi:hypothetical protein EDB89DRAFT_2150035 [Lactarius sanguifluus]|nr:hypothetical protein EDB89DRAFT_2150035 [Lactarius sanguifluus]